MSNETIYMITGFIVLTNIGTIISVISAIINHRVDLAKLQVSVENQSQDIAELKQNLKKAFELFVNRV